MVTSPEFRKEYIHKEWGRVVFLVVHPQDGSLVVIKRQEIIDPYDGDLVLDTCERSDLTETDIQDQWPYLGFTTRPQVNLC